MKINKPYMKGLFYVLPSIELCFSKAVKGSSGLILGITEKPYDQCYVYIAWLVWGIRFKIKFR